MPCLSDYEHLNCGACSLHRSRKRVVPGHGNPKARILLVGEAPGREEDMAGKPFVGKAGEELDKLLNEVGLSRAEIFLTNVVHCRPPRNDIRAVPDALYVCPTKWLASEIEMVRPRVIVTLGMTAAGQYFPGIATAHQVAQLARATPDWVVVGALHPAFALRVREAEESIRESFRRAMRYAER